MLSAAKHLVDNNETLRSAQGDRRQETADRWSTQLDFAKCQGALGLRRRRAGDRFQPAGLGGHTQTLHEFMINAKIPRAARPYLPLLVVDDQIVWVCGWRADERARTTDATREFWQITFRKKENP
jgi:tRNA(Ile)-lysidine synthase